MADTYGSSSLCFSAKASADVMIMNHGSAVEAIRSLLDGATVTLSGAEVFEVIQVMQLMAIVEVADLIGPLVPHMGEQS